MHSNRAFKKNFGAKLSLALAICLFVNGQAQGKNLRVKVRHAATHPIVVVEKNLDQIVDMPKTIEGAADAGADAANHFVACASQVVARTEGALEAAQDAAKSVSSLHTAKEVGGQAKVTAPRQHTNWHLGNNTVKQPSSPDMACAPGPVIESVAIYYPESDVRIYVPTPKIANYDHFSDTFSFEIAEPISISNQSVVLEIHYRIAGKDGRSKLFSASAAINLAGKVMHSLAWAIPVALVLRRTKASSKRASRMRSRNRKVDASMPKSRRSSVKLKTASRQVAAIAKVAQSVATPLAKVIKKVCDDSG